MKLYHYTYRISNVLLNKHYYGSRTSKLPPEHDLGVNYFSSSKSDCFGGGSDWIKDQKVNPQNYKYKIVRVYITREEAIELEIKLHNKFNVKNHESFYNASNQTCTGFDRTGMKHTEITKRKISIAHRNVTLSTPHKRAIKHALNTPETKCLLKSSSNKYWSKKSSHTKHSKLMLDMHSNNAKIRNKISIGLMKWFSNIENRVKLGKALIKQHKEHPETAIKKSKSRLSELNNYKRAQETGVYVTPLCNYVSLPESVNISQGVTMSHTNVRRWCKNSNKQIVIQSALNNDLLTELDIGKTRKEIGFYMIFPKSAKEAIELVNPIRTRLGLELEVVQL